MWHGRKGVVEGGVQVNGDFFDIAGERRRESRIQRRWSNRVHPSSAIRSPSFKVGHMFRHTLCWKIEQNQHATSPLPLKAEYDDGFKN